jgi:hypothetical protein
VDICIYVYFYIYIVYIYIYIYIYSSNNLYVFFNVYANECIHIPSDRLGNTITNNLESSLSTLKNWNFFSDKNHWENGYWEKMITNIQNTDLKNTDFIQNPDGFLSRITDKLSTAGERFSNQYELSKTQSFNNLGIHMFYLYSYVWIYVYKFIYVYV